MTRPDYSNTTLDELIEYIDELMAIDSENLDAEARRGPKIFSELNRFYAAQSRKLEKLLVQHAKVKNIRYRRYAGKWTAEQYKKEPLAEAILKSDIDKYLAIDDQMIEIDSLVREQERIVVLIEESQKRLKDRVWELGRAIEFKRFIAGV